MKEFEEIFSELQADMVSICLEYVEDRANKVFIYASKEEGVVSSSFFYLINDQYLECHKVNDALKIGEEKYDVSTERIFKVLDILTENINKISKLCKEFERDMPTEMKIVYDVTSSKVQAKYNYELVYSDDELKTAQSIADQWFDEMSSKSPLV